MTLHIKSQTGKSPKGEAKTALLLGAGYTARHLAKPLLAQGYDVWGTSRSESKKQALIELNIHPLILEGFNDEILHDVFERADIIISSVPPLKSKCPEGYFDPVIIRMA